MGKPHRFIVVDQNKMRHVAALADALDRCCREDLRLLIPDGAGFELSDVSNPLYTWRRSLSVLCRYPELVAVSQKLTKIMCQEIACGRPAEALIDDDGTHRFGELLRKMASGDDSDLRAMIDGPVKSLVRRTSSTDSARHKSLILALRGQLSAMMTEETLGRLRRAPEAELATWLTSVDGIRFVFQWITHNGACAEFAFALSSGPSVSAAFASSLAAVAVYWLAFGGLESAPPEKVTNDLHDAEYAVLGSISVELLTGDSRLRRIDEALRKALFSRTEWCRKALLVGPANA